MTDRIVVLTVALNRPYREDDAQPLMDAIGLLQGVLSVTAEPVSPEYWAAREAAEAEIRNRVWETLHQKDGPHV